MCEYKCGLGFAKLFSGERIRKTETNFFEIRREFVLVFRAQAGSGRECARGFLDWKKWLKNDKIIL